MLTYPLTLVPPAQMIEHYILSNLPSLDSLVGSASTSTVSPLRGESRTGSRRGEHGYGAVELADVTDAETATTLTPLTGSDADLNAAAHGAHTQVSVTARIANRVTIVAITTIIATWIPCFGMVSELLYVTAMIAEIAVILLHFLIILFASLRFCCR